jgi:uncharacterized Zn finger protein (UPF0148 family)
MNSHTCPVCGYPKLHEVPRSAKTSGGSYEICPSCGFQFGVTDDDQGYTYEEWREQWIGKGMKWSSVTTPDGKWNPIDQLRRIGVNLDAS